jgi:hypothetical protein
MSRIRRHWESPDTHVWTLTSYLVTAMTPHFLWRNVRVTWYSQPASWKWQTFQRSFMHELSYRSQRRESQRVTKPESLLPFPQEPSTGPCLERDASATSAVPKLFGPPPPRFHIHTNSAPLHFFKKHKCAFVSTFILYLKNCLNKIIRVKLNVLCVNW